MFVYTNQYLVGTVVNILQTALASRDLSAGTWFRLNQPGNPNNCLNLPWLGNDWEMNPCSWDTPVCYLSYLADVIQTDIKIGRGREREGGGGETQRYKTPLSDNWQNPALTTSRIRVWSEDIVTHASRLGFCHTCDQALGNFTNENGATCANEWSMKWS